MKPKASVHQAQRDRLYDRARERWVKTARKQGRGIK